MNKVFFRIVLLELLAFSLIISALWMDEAFDFANILFGSPKVPFNFVEAITESFLIIMLAGGVILSNFYFFRRIKHLEGLYVICAFCKKVKTGENWIPLEQFLDAKTDVQLSHSFCQACAKQHYNVTL